MRRTILFIIHMTGNLLGWFLYLRRGEHYHVSRVHIELIFSQYTSQQKQSLLHASMLQSGKTIVETVVYWLFPNDLFINSIREVKGEAHLRAAQAAGRSVILVSPHLGNWEIFNMYAGKQGSYTTYKPLKSSWLDRYIRRRRERHGAKLIPLSTTGIRTLYRELNGGGIVLVFPDQLPDGSGRVIVPFFGLQARTGILVARLLQKSNAVVICGFAHRLPNAQGFDIHLFPVADAVYSDSQEISAAALNKEMENCIMRCPEQYLWEYKRFKYTVDSGLYKRLSNLD